jgi:hypothetical protein
MSVAEFSPVLRQKIIEVMSDSSNKIDLASFGPKTRKQLFKEAPDTKDIRSKFESSKYHTSSLTIDGMQELTTRLITVVEEDTAKTVVEDFFNSPNFFIDFVGYVEQNESVSEFGATDYRIENVPQENLKKLFVRYLRENLTGGVSQSVIDNLAKNIESGHLAGVFFLKLKTALGVNTEFSKDVNATYRDFTVSMPGLSDDKALRALDTILKAVLDADYLTSHLITNSQVMVDATKSVLGSNPTLVTELQFKQDNKAAGDLLQQTGRQLNALISGAIRGETSPVDGAIEKLIQSLKPLAAAILQKAEDLKEPLSSQGIYNQIVDNAKYLSETLINTPGSVTLKDGIGKSLANLIDTGKVLPASNSKIKLAPIIEQHKEVLDISKVAKDFKKAAETLKAAVKKTKVSKNVNVRAGRSAQDSTNLLSLLNLINAHIQNVVSANMGDGSSRNVLNYRTGRFASSVKVEKLSKSRAGMITAFYSYMRNPYGTFSSGGRQEFPKSRDPKLLISKSIKEIVSKKMADRMRAVLV